MCADPEFLARLIKLDNELVCKDILVATSYFMILVSLFLIVETRG